MKIKFTILIILIFFASRWMHAQDAVALYDTAANGQQQINEAVKKAAAENKHVFLMIGGNWCKWCKLFNTFSMSNPQIDSLLKADYVVEHINFSKQNRNLPLMEKLGFPQRFGFPVFVLLDSKGNRLHTQRTDYLEEGQGYSQQKVAEFLEQWSPAALKAEQYIK